MSGSHSLLLCLTMGLATGWVWGKIWEDPETAGPPTIFPPPERANGLERAELTEPSPALSIPADPPESPMLRKYLAEQKRLAGMPLDQMAAAVMEKIAQGATSMEIDALFEEWENRDPMHYLKWRSEKGQSATVRPFTSTTSAHGGIALKRLALQDPQAAWEQAGAAFSRPGGARWNLISDLFGSHPEQAVTMTGTYAAELSSYQNPGSFSQHDPAQWLPVLTALEPGTVRSGMIRQGLQYYQQQPHLDPAAAVHWLHSLPEGLKQEALHRLQAAVYAPAGMERENLGKMKAAAGVSLRQQPR